MSSTATVIAVDPFTLMMNPAAVLQAMEGSQRLGALRRRVCRPLDRPLIPRQGSADLAAYDREIDLAADEPSLDDE